MTNNAAETAPVEQTDAPSRVVAVQESLVTIRAGWRDGNRLPLKKNEVVYIETGRSAVAGRQERLKSEVLRVRGELADVQVFEDTGGVAVGDPVVQTPTFDRIAAEGVLFTHAFCSAPSCTASRGLGLELHSV